MPDISVLYTVGPMLLILVVIAAVMLDRWSVPVIVIALGVAIIFGSDVLNWWHFEDVKLTNQLANLALVFILFQGGFGTRRDTMRLVALPAIGMATWGVVLTSLTTFGILWGVLGWAMEPSLLLAVIISSTDAAATFSILRRHPLPPKLSATIEIESAANDPMAIVLTLAAIDGLTSGEAQWHTVVLAFIWKFTLAPVIGWLAARGAVWLFNKLTPQDRGHYYVLSLAAMLLTFGLAETAGASGMLAVFVAGFVMGNSAFVHKQGVTNFNAALSDIANIGMFVMMGLLVFPSQWSDLWIEGIVLFLVLTFISRPVAVWLGTFGMKLSHKERVFIAWAGLRGAVPIILATFPLAQEMAAGEEVFNLVFFAVILSVLFQGSTLGPVARWLGLTVPPRPRTMHQLELITMAKSDMDLFVIDLPGPRGTVGPRIRDLTLPPDAVITLITRGRNVVLPKGNTHLKGWDQVTVLAHATDEPAVRAALLTPFEKREEPPEPPATPPDDAAKPPQDPAKPPEPSTKPPEEPAAEK